MGYTLEERREYGRRWRAAHPNYMRDYGRSRRAEGDPEERRREGRERYRAKHPDASPRRAQTAYRREYNATRHHGITRGQRDALYKSQGGLCAGCATPAPDAELDIDHDHGHCPGKWSCGRCVRGLVCRRCNLRDVLAGHPSIDFGTFAA